MKYQIPWSLTSSSSSCLRIQHLCCLLSWFSVASLSFSSLLIFYYFTTSEEKFFTVRVSSKLCAVSPSAASSSLESVSLLAAHFTGQTRLWLWSRECQLQSLSWRVCMTMGLYVWRLYSLHNSCPLSKSLSVARNQTKVWVSRRETSSSLSSFKEQWKQRDF